MRRKLALTIPLHTYRRLWNRAADSDVISALPSLTVAVNVRGRTTSTSTSSRQRPHSAIGPWPAIYRNGDGVVGTIVQHQVSVDHTLLA